MCVHVLKCVYILRFLLHRKTVTCLAFSRHAESIAFGEVGTNPSIHIYCVEISALLCVLAGNASGIGCTLVRNMHYIQLNVYAFAYMLHVTLCELHCCHLS